MFTLCSHYALTVFHYAPTARGLTCTDLVAYLETTFACMMFMADAVREAVHFTSCKHISSSLVVSVRSTRNLNSRFVVVIVLLFSCALLVVVCFSAFVVLLLFVVTPLTC